MLERIEKSLFEIKDTLLNSQKIRNNLYYASADKDFSGEKIDIGKTLVEKYIVLYPIYNLNGDFSKSLWIQIVMDSCENSENNCLIGIARINIIMDNTKWVQNNVVYPLNTANEVIRLLDGKKFSISNILQFDSIVPLAIDKQISGYALLFNFVDGNAEPDNL